MHQRYHMLMRVVSDQLGGHAPAGLLTVLLRHPVLRVVVVIATCRGAQQQPLLRTSSASASCGLSTSLLNQMVTTTLMEQLAGAEPPEIHWP
jgi:hypothetical protein